MATHIDFQQDPAVQKKRWLILFAVGLFTFMATLDGSIVNIALPTMSKELQVPTNQITWVVSIYLMTICTCLPLFGKIGDSVGKIKIFKLGTFIFVIGSFLCGVPHSLTTLLVGRVIQALGASMTMATNIGIITEVFPFHERGRALGLIGTFVSLGSITGPGIGGVLVANMGWSYIFWINVPVGLLAMVLGKYILPQDFSKSGVAIDWLGFISFASFLLPFFASIFLGQEIGFLQPLILGLLAISVLSFVLFYYREKRVAQPLIDFKLFNNQVLTAGLVTAMLVFAANFFMNVVLPFFLQNAHGYDASFAGLLMMVFPLVMVVTAPVSGYFTDKYGPRVLTIIGLAIMTLAQLSFAFIDLKTPLWWFIVSIGLLGLGNGIFQSPNNTIVMSSVSLDQLGVAGSLNGLFRNIGMVIGIALSTTLLYGSMSHRAGYPVTTYLEDHPNYFIYGMHVVYTGAFILCSLAMLLTIYSFKHNRHAK